MGTAKTTPWGGLTVIRSDGSDAAEAAPVERITQKMEITLNHDVDIHVRLHMSALCVRRRDLRFLFDKVVICQVDCWRIQPNTERPGQL